MVTTVQELEMATELAQMKAALAAQQAEIASLRAHQPGEGDGSLETAIRTFEAERVQPTTYTTMPCLYAKDGVTCGRRSADHIEERLGMNPMPLGHTFRLRPFEASAKPKPRAFYQKDEPVAVVAAPDTSIEDTYLTVAQTAKALKMKSAEVKALIADGQLKADKVLGTTVVRKVAVERLIALASIAEEDADVA